MKRGRYRNRVTIEEKVSAGQDDYGDNAGEKWQPIAEPSKRWADILYQTGKEASADATPAEGAKASIRIPRDRVITTAMRVVWGTHVFEIKSIGHSLDDTDLACIEGLNNG